MRNLNYLNECRVLHPFAGWGDEKNGAFLIRLPFSNLTFTVIASSGGGWEHVSVSTPERCPKWNEMQAIKEMFFEDEEAVIQIHPPKSKYVNNHPNCLHLWRPVHEKIPLPDVMMV